MIASALRRLVVPALLLLLAAACVTPGVEIVFPGIPIIGRVRVGGTPRVPPQPPPQPVPCTEIARIPCDFVHCDRGYDLVTLQCPGKGAAARCIENTGCGIDEAE